MVLSVVWRSPGPAMCSGSHVKPQPARNKLRCSPTGENRRGESCRVQFGQSQQKNTRLAIRLLDGGVATDSKDRDFRTRPTLLFRVSAVFYEELLGNIYLGLAICLRGFLWPVIHSCSGRALPSGSDM